MGDLPVTMMPPARPGLFERSQHRLDGRAALVTGAGDAGDELPSIGFAIAVLFGVAGADVAVLDIDARAAQYTADQIRGLGGRACAVVADVRCQDEVDRAVRNAGDQFGRLDAIVNNAAVLGSASTLDAADEEFQRTLDINVMGVIRVSRAALPHLGRGSSITHISSLGSLRSFGKLDYETSKGAINTMVNTMAVQYGPRGIRVNAVSPGQVWTPMGLRRLVTMGLSAAEIAAHRKDRSLGVPLCREGTSWDIAAASLFLASDDATWITGQILGVDGGQGGVVGYLSHSG
jgi:hypothetical protein